MGDLKTPYDNPAMSAPDLGGDLATARGNDPNITIDSPNGLKAVWEDPFVQFGGEATANSVSGLPLTPQRFQPTETPEMPPDLSDRSPGTIDRK